MTWCCRCAGQYVQVQEQPAQMWNQAQAALHKISPMQMMKQPGQNPPPAFYMAPQEPLKMYEQQLQPPGQPPLAAIDKKMKFPNVKMQQDFYWEPSYRMGDRMKRLCPEDPPAGPRGLPFEVRSGEEGEKEEEREEAVEERFLSLWEAT